VSHALLPAFTLAWRLDVAETIGSVVGHPRDPSPRNTLDGST
jgi:hypothetical protein